MSDYKDFLNELPKRIKKLLERYYEQEKISHYDSYEVTLLLSLSTSLFCSNVEIIKNDKNNSDGRLENKSIKEIVNKNKNDLLFEISDEWLTGDTENIQIEYFEIHNIKKERLKKIRDSHKDFFTVLKQIRNGLAHAGIRFYAEKDEQIKSIMLRSQKSLENPELGFYIHIIPVNDYKRFLFNWCNFMVKQKFNLLDFLKQTESYDENQRSKSA